MKITIDTEEFKNKLKQGVKKYGKYTKPGMIASAGKMVGKTIKDKMDRDAIKNRVEKGYSGRVIQPKKLYGTNKLLKKK
jgi:hypothetical protein